MQGDHLTLEGMADWLSGRLEHEEVLAWVVPHLTGACARCRATYEEVRRLQEEVGHWDESVAVREGLAAPALLAALERLPVEERAPRVEGDPAYQTWGLCRALLAASAAALPGEPARAAAWADLAVRATRHLTAAYHPDWVSDLTARAWARLGHARRLCGEAEAAAAAFREAERALARSGSGDPRVAAEVRALMMG